MVLLLPLLLNHTQTDIQKKKCKVKWILNAASAYFFAQVATWAGIMFVYTGLEDQARYYKVQNFDAANKLLPAILLMVSILLFRLKFNSN